MNMQIKKGPYGYYAVEKLEEPDRLCTYAEEVIAGNKSDFYLTPCTEYMGPNVMCYYEFSDYLQITDPGFSVFSPGRKNAPHKKEIHNLSLRRKSAGDLFYTFVKMLDNLISPSCIVLDPDMVFTDPDGIAIKLCCLPVKTRPEELTLSSLGATRLEILLNCDFFKNIITDDERNALVYSVKENNEDLFLKTAETISGTDRRTDNEKSENTAERMSGSGILQTLTRTEKDLIISALSSLLSLVSLIGKLYLPCFLFVLLSVVILVMSLLNQKKQETHKKAEESLEQSRKRSTILFSENPGMNSKRELEPDDTAEENFRQFPSITTGLLTLLSERKGINKKYSLYLDETTIGSDCFLSDIVLDESGIAPLHAVIRQKNGSFYIEPAQGTGRTYIESSPVENGKNYEIKSGQKITVGDIEFRFTTN